jgi:hypothetical protein
MTLNSIVSEKRTGGKRGKDASVLRFTDQP